MGTTPALQEERKLHTAWLALGRVVSVVIGLAMIIFSTMHIWTDTSSGVMWHFVIFMVGMILAVCGIFGYVDKGGFMLSSPRRP
jgi:hypothetical protein